MRGCSVLEGVDEEAELALCFLVSDSDDLEHTFLILWIIDTNAAAAEFSTVEHKVVGVGAYLKDVFRLVGVVVLQMLRLGCGEGMMQGVPLVLLVVPLEEREVGEPEGCENVGFAEAETVSELYTELSQTGLRLALVAAEDEDEVAGFGFRRFGYLKKVFVAEELVH